MSKKKTAVKDHSDKDRLLIHANYVLRMFDSIFETSAEPSIIQEDGHVSIMLHDMALLYIKMDSGNNVICVASFHDDCPIILGAELTCCLKDIFGVNLYVNEDTYVQDEVNKGLIWGRERIDIHHDRTWGRKITHTVMFDETLAGHS